MATAPKFERYVDRAGRWRWHFITANGKVIADSGQGYGSLADCDHAIAVLKRYAPTAPLT